LEQKKTSHITTALALEFAMLHPQQEPKAQAGRYSAVRGFASYRIGVDPATEIPPCGLVRGRTRRARPYLYSDQEVCQLLEAARKLPSTYSLRPLCGQDARGMHLTTLRFIRGWRQIQMTPPAIRSA
jgi:hypothetical protein